MLQPILAAIRATPGDNTTLGHWAQRVHSTERTLARRFQQQLGILRLGVGPAHDPHWGRPGTDDADAIAQKIRRAKTDPLPMPDTLEDAEKRPDAPVKLAPSMK